MTTVYEQLRSSGSGLSPIIVQRDGQHLTVDGDGLVALDVPGATRLVTSADADHGYRVERRTESLLRGPDAMRRPNKGSLLVLQHLAQQRGQTVNVVPLGPPISALAEPPTATSVPDSSLAGFMLRHQNGLIRIGASVTVAGLILQIADLFSGARIIVLGAQRRQLDALRQKLAKYSLILGRQQDDTDARDQDQEPQVTCTTFIGAAAEGVDLATADVVLLLDHAAHQHAECALSAVDAQFRLYGIVRSDRRLSPYETTVTMRTFGPAVLDIPQHGWELSPVHVAWCPMHATRVPGDPDILAVKRMGYWRNRNRNQGIARLARQLVAGEDNCLCRDPAAMAWLSNWYAWPPGVAVLVENVEHAVVLAELLEGWPIIAGHESADDVDTVGLPRRHRRLLQARPAGWMSDVGRIVTQAAAGRYDFSRVNVVLWAGGGPHRPNLPVGWQYQRAGSNRPRLLVDFSDRHHPQLASWARQRRLDYVDAEWFDVGVRPINGRIVKFLHEVCGMTSGNLSEMAISGAMSGRRYQFAIHGRPGSRSGRAGRARAERRQARGRREPYRVSSFSRFSFREFSRPESLMAAYRRLCAEGGPAPGTDYLSYTDFSPAEIYEALRQVSRALKNRQWVPYEPRLVLIPKPDGRNRELRLKRVLDRVVAKALQLALERCWRRILPGLRLSVWELFARLEKAILDRGWYVLATDDVRDAFPSARIADVLADHREYIRHGKLLWLIETIIRGHEGHRKTAGLEQGCPYSPTAMELRLRHGLDRRLEANGPGQPLQLRYVDNITYQCRSISEGLAVLSRTREILEPQGLFLKQKDGDPVDLRDPENNRVVLGLNLKWQNNSLKLILPDSAYGKLREGLLKAHETHDPPDIAHKVVTGWLRAMGPTLVTGMQSVISRVTDEMRAMGFRELSEGKLLQAAQEGRDGWLSLRQRILQENTRGRRRRENQG